MQRQKTGSDFVLFPVDSSSDMLALDSSRRQHLPFFAQPIDSATMEPFSYTPFEHHDDFHPLSQSQDSARSLPHSYYDTPSMYVESTPEMHMAFPSTPPPMATSHFPEHMSTLSSASGPSIASAASSAIGSPYSGATHGFSENWIDTNHGLGLPAAVMNDLVSNDCNQIGGTVDPDSAFSPEKFPDNFVDPYLVQPMQRQPTIPTTMSYAEDQASFVHASGFMSPSVGSPLPGHQNLPTPQLPQQQLPMASPYMVGLPQQGGHIFERQSSISPSQSPRLRQSPAISQLDGDDEAREKGRCPFPDCGRVFKDLKAHMLTHQSERPEKCPIVTCEYHLKGFARKYDKNRHTLTHYKGTMVCGFCPGSGSAAEKSFNRADVFKRHLMSVHGVEQTPPNCRKRSPAASSTNKKLSGYSENATGKCSTCSATFSTPQDFYEHLDDCVLRVVQQEEPSEAINQRRLAEVASDEEVKKTMEKHNLPTTPIMGVADRFDEYNDDDDDNDNDSNDSHNGRSGKGSLKTTKPGSNSTSRSVLGTSSAVTKCHGGGASKPRAAVSRRRGNRNNYPQSWGCPSSKMKMKRRVLCVYSGKRRLWKDEMMLGNEFEVRLRLPGGAGDGTNRDAYVTDLDVETLKRAEGVLNATEEERGRWLGGSSNGLMGQPAVLLPDIPHGHVEEVDLDEFMV
ncbi:hypothetical protein VTN77DRAFT_7755 [Rasamsonia byssochlamydoides]|uniref:uncharacterized protein n=1 Tax=Rasamsonia byssochlamydoides TaxID=89139 RepID=UPI0037430E4E